MKRIVVDPPTSDARRERVERQLFQQLAAVRVADRADAVIPPPKKSRAGIAYAFAGIALAAAIALVITRGGEPGGSVASPSRVVTPMGAESRFTIGREAVIDAKSDTSVEWHQSADGAITLTLERGAVDCQVEPRAGRPPFRVVSGDVSVIVVGTRFTVTRTPNPRVDVAHGKVRVEAPGGTWMVEAGESWTPMSMVRASQTSDLGPQTSASEDGETPAAEIEMEPIAVGRPKKHTTHSPKPDSPTEARGLKSEASEVEPPKSRELAKEAYRVAQRLEATDPEHAAAMYRAIAISEKAGGFAASALISLAELQIYKLKSPRAALATLDEHEQRFPNAVTREEAAWFRIEALHSLGKRDEARGAAADYLREFPKGVYADRLSNGPRP
jgi:ferric-dicitrate binding protein FerR (iron transport regulator)